MTTVEALRAEVLARVCDIDQVDALITDTLADDGVVARIGEVGVDVTVVPAPAA